MISFIKRILPDPIKKFIKKIVFRNAAGLDRLARRGYKLRKPFTLPDGWLEQDLRELICSFSIDHDSSNQELRTYAAQDFARFIHTLNLAKHLKGKALELGSNPYFTTHLLRKFTDLNLTCANYAGPHVPDGCHKQNVFYSENGVRKSISYDYWHFNMEVTKFPFADNSFDVVFFCEILEHLTVDPIFPLLEIKRILKPNGKLVLTTPNVARLENVTSLIAGNSIYDPYSGYGAYGRHNREYTMRELRSVLEFCGFTIENAFTSDVHDNHFDQHVRDVNQVLKLTSHRKDMLGQYLFSISANDREAQSGYPSFLYRSMPAGTLVPVE